MKPFQFITSDGITIAGIQNNPSRVTKRILCLHMLPATKESYVPFLEAGESRGWLMAAIDFRGHGESTNSGELNWENFSDAEHKKYLIDAFEAMAYVGQGKTLDAVIGASIGANVALHLQATDQLPVSVLLSPGKNYRGVDTLSVAPQLVATQKCYVISSNEVNQAGTHMADEAKEIFEALATPHKKLDIFEGVAHGTDIIASHKEALKKIFDFIKLV